MTSPLISFILLRIDQPQPDTPQWDSMLYYVKLTGLEIHQVSTKGLICKTTKAHFELLFGISEVPKEKRRVKLVDDRVENRYWAWDPSPQPVTRDTIDASLP